jgi:hypothetical protein
MLDPARIKKADARQLTLPPNELTRLCNRIQEDFRAALADHDSRMRRFTRYYRRWRSLADMPAPGEERNPNFDVPLTKWQVYSKWAKEHGALFGEEADIEAKPIGASDQRQARKASRFMTWAAFDHIKIQNPAAIFDFRKVLNGRSIAYAPWTRETYRVPTIDGDEIEQVAFEGPAFDPLWPDDIIVPAEDVRNLHEFSWLIRKYRATPEELLQGEEDGRYQGIASDFEEFVNFASHKRQRDFESEMVKREKDIAEGVVYEGNLSAANCVNIHEWYGRWRMLKGRRDAREDNFDRRERRETELVIRYVPEMHRIIGAQRLDEMYPRLQHRRPFVEASLVKDGSYWCPGFGELLEDMEEELSVNHRLATKAGMFSVGPVVLYRPSSGFDPDTFSYEPYQAIACDDPNGVRIIDLKANLEYTQVKEQAVLGYAERVTGITDMAMGRAIDRPNAPRTARQTLALLGEGDVRASLDMTALREDWGEILVHFWELYQEYAPEKLFFRVTEDDANGLFDVKCGQAYMTPDELGSRYDFDIKFATNAESREQSKQNTLALYQIDLQNPLVQQNPRALWMLLDRIHKAFDDDEFGDLIPQPPDVGMPKQPKEEWAMVLHGEDIHVNPLDNDQLHLLDHNKRIQDAKADPDRDEEAWRAMVLHAMEHMQQIQQKKLMQQMVSSLTDTLARNTATGQGLQQQGAPLSLQQLHQHVGDMMMGNQPGAAPDGQPGAQPGALPPMPAAGPPAGGRR